ncbi:MAG TPA: NADH-quinone oxidoreductase subunit C, partial [Coriobacteriia bacterium]|nr:NADH-quinone oxidoreductase subunit C [Coriobacteriia bacterium]
MNITELREHLCETYPQLCPLFSIEFGDGVLAVEAGDLHEAAENLRDLGFDRLGMVTAVDHPPHHIEAVYRLQSRSMSAALFLKCLLDRGAPRVASLCDVWPAALWQEREVFEMFGVVFDGHPDLRPLLLPEGSEGHP